MVQVSTRATWMRSRRKANSAPLVSRVPMMQTVGITFLLLPRHRHPLSRPRVPHHHLPVGPAAGEEGAVAAPGERRDVLQVALVGPRAAAVEERGPAAPVPD